MQYGWYRIPLSEHDLKPTVVRTRLIFNRSHRPIYSFLFFYRDNKLRKDHDKTEEDD